MQEVETAVSTPVWRRVRTWMLTGVPIPFIVLFVILAVTNKYFLEVTNLLNILDQQSAVLLIAAAGTLVIVAGGLDLSVGATYALAGVLSAMTAQHHPVWVSVVAGLAVGLAVGLLNGVIVTFARINPLIATLAMSYVVSGLGARITDGNLIVMADHPEYSRLATSHFLGVTSATWITIAVLVALGLVLARTTLGRYMLAVGGNAEAARLAGIRVAGIRILTFALSGMAAALAGMIDVSRVLSAQAQVGSTLAFTVLAAIVVGGTSIAGGDGTIGRTIVGVLFVALIGNGFDLVGIDPLYKQITLGVILLLAVGIDAWQRGRQR